MKLPLPNLFLILILLASINSYFLIPFKLEPNYIPINDGQYIQFLISPYTYLKLGNPIQKIFAYIRLDYTCTFFANNYVPYSDSVYNESYSNTFKNTSLWWWSYSNLKELCKANEVLSLLSNNTVEVSIQLKEIFYTNTHEAVDNKTYPGGVIGLGMSTKEMIYCKPFVELLKNSDINLKKNTFSIRFYNQKYRQNEEKFNGYDGEFLFNIFPHQMDNISFKEEEYKTHKIGGSISEREFKLEFDNIYITLDNNNKIYLKDDKATTIRFNFNLGIITCRDEYFNLTKNYVFNELINESICQVNFYSLSQEDYEQRYYLISCDKKKITQKYKNLNNFYSKFPILCIESKIFNYTFSLNGFELFSDLNNQIIFNIVKDIYGNKNDGWVFGKLFLEKYYFIFDSEDLQIGFYPSNPFGEKIYIEKTGNSALIIKIIIICLCVIICIGLGFLIGKKCYEQKKKRANELKDDDYEYNESKEDKDNKLIED